MWCSHCRDGHNVTLNLPHIITRFNMPSSVPILAPPPQMPGVLVPKEDAHDLKEAVASHIGRDRTTFPGAQPVSFGREHLAELHREGTLLLSGPLGGAPGALLIVEAESEDAALAALDGDPFKRERVIVDRSVREWTVVIGQLPGA